MADVIEFRLEGADELLERLARVDDELATQGLSDAVGAGAKFLEGQVKVKIQGQDLIDTGNYLASWGSRVTRAGRDYAEAEVATQVPYGPVHEFGGTIVPSKARLLAIPQTREARMLGSPREMPGLVFVRAKSGQMFLMDEAGTVQYVLAASVTIPARPHVRPAFDENTDEVGRILAASLSGTIEGALR